MKIIHVGHKCDYYCFGCIYSLRKIIDRTREGVVLKSLYSDTKILSKYIPSLQKKL
jgi:hypothetical protein